MEGIVVQKSADGVVLWNGFSIAQDAVFSGKGAFIDHLKGMMKDALIGLLRNPHDTVGGQFLFQKKVDEV